MPGPVLAAIDSFGYRAVLVLHIAATSVAFGASIVLEFVKRRSGDQPAIRLSVMRTAIEAGRYLLQPALWLGLGLGVVLVLLGDDAWSFGDAWISAAFLVWALLVGAELVIGRADRRRAVLGEQMGRDDVAASPAEMAKLDQRAAAFGMISQVGFVVLLVLMVWKPGS